MKFISTWSFKDGKIGDAARKFLTEGAPAPEGATILGRWHKADLSGGFVLTESDDPATAYESAAQWADVLEIHVVPVIEDEQAGAILAKHFGG